MCNRGIRSLYGCCPCNDKDIILINKETQKKYKLKVNAFNKVYWFDKDYNLCFLDEKLYDKYEIIAK